METTGVSKKARLTLAAAAVALFALLFMVLGAGSAQAETYKFDPSNECTFSLNKSDSYIEYSSIWYFVDSYDDTVTDLNITNVKSSNKKIATAEASGMGIYLSVKARKTGKSTITWKIDGVSYKRVVKVVYTNPMSKIKVAGKSYLSKFKKTNTVKISKSLKNKRIVIKAKTGWKITGYKTFKGMYSKSKTKSYAKGKKSISVKISTVYPYNGITVTFTNTKTGREQEINFKKAMGGGYSYTG